jgi:hypothetical protein
MSKRRTTDRLFIMRPVEMLNSPAMRALSLTGHCILARLEIQLSAKRGWDNGKLAVTHADFCEYGIGHNAIGSGIREVVALGFVEQTRRGFAGPTQRCPSLFRLTYLPAHPAKPTDEWRSIGTIEEAEAIAQKARASRPRREASFNQRRKKFRVITSGDS